MLPRSKPFHALLAIGLLGSAAPALAADPVTDAQGRVYDVPPIDPRPEWKPAPTLPAMPAPGVGPMTHPGPSLAAFEEAKLAWLDECRSRFPERKGRTTGTIVGGLVGGVAGSAVAGRGDRVVGAIAGGTLGAVAGSAIGSASDKHRGRDYCEAYLEDYLARQHHGFGPVGYGPGYSHGYAMYPVMMVPVAMVPVAIPPAPKHDCTETTVIEEWVTVTPPKRRIITDKRVRIVPDKRVRTK